MSADNFERYVRSFNDGDQSRLGEMFGWFSNRIPVYPDTLHLETRFLAQDGDRRPVVRIGDVHSDHPLYVEQRDGISAERLGEIYARSLREHGRE